jgi:ABC-type dipeptide/oligopeptide/nickel transport system permease component
MIALVLKRVIHGFVVLWVVATLTFLALRLAPGGPFDSERRLPPEVLANLEAKYHLDESIARQYLGYLAGIAQGDFGPSYKYLDRGEFLLFYSLWQRLFLWGSSPPIFAVLCSTAAVWFFPPSVFPCLISF